MYKISFLRLCPGYRRKKGSGTRWCTGPVATPGTYSPFHIQLTTAAILMTLSQIVCALSLRAQSWQSAKLFLQSSELGLPHLHSRRPVCPPPPHPLGGGGGHTHLWERGWGSPNSDEGTYNVVFCTDKYFVP